MFGKLLAFLDGKKTAIGAGLMIVGQFIPGIHVGEIIPAIDTLVVQVGTVVGAVGLVHKAVKSLLGKARA